MECRNCGRALDDDARFCPGCGVAVVSSCAACGAVLDADARFCKLCGTAVETATGAGGRSRDETASRSSGAERERKVATLLFADIAGFTSLSEQHDAEVVSRLVSETFERLAAEVDRYGGTVEKFAGDALLAVFGVPVIHEDDSERAVRAALEMQSLMASHRDEGSLGLRVRIGIESGEVLADLERSSDERDLFVTGDAVNTASRLQAVAEPGKVVVGPATYASTRGLIEYEELAPRALKGKELPVASWRAIRVRARRGGMRAPLGIEAQLIGRDEELTLLKETIRRTVTEGRPHLVTVAGEAGVGKTRLIWELEKYLDGLPEMFHWRKGRCYSYASVSYSPIVEAVKADASIADDDAPADVTAKLDARIADLAGDDGQLPVRAALRVLMGLPGEQPLPQDELFEAWRIYLAAIATRHPLVLVTEDIHWADAVTLDFIEFMARWGDAPVTIICVARPELLELRDTWGGGIRNASMVELLPLEADESLAMIDELLDGALPAAVRDRVVAMANGNPLFTEELVRMFVDQGALRMLEGAWRFVGAVDDLSVPSSVQAVLSARLDELATDEKRIAQEASVVGRIFWDVIVAHLRDRSASEVEDALRGLRVKELVTPRTPSTLAGAAEWSFHHVLVRDVAYDSLPKSDRGALHLQVARWAERELADRIDEFAELVASHTVAALRYEEELRTSSQDDETILALREQTFEAAARAARRAGAVQDRQSARRWQMVAIEQARRLGRPPLDRARLAEEFFDLTGEELDSAERVAVFLEATDLLEPVRDLDQADREMWGRLRAHLGHAYFEDTMVAEAKEVLQDAAEVLRPNAPSRARALVLQTHSWVLWHSYDFDAAETVVAEAIDEARASGADDVIRGALHESGIIKGFKGDPSDALKDLKESLVLATEADDRDLLNRCYVNIPSVQLNSGYALEEADVLLRRGLPIARRTAAYFSLAFLYDNLAGLLWFQGRFAEMLEATEEELESARRAGFSAMFTSAKRGYADALTGLGRREEAAEALREGVDLSMGDKQHVEWLWLAQSRLDMIDEPERAIARLSGVHPELKGYPNSELAIAIWLARMAYRLGDAAALHEAIETQHRHEQVGGPARRLEQAWVTALAADDAVALAALSPEFEDTGHRLYAAEALIDVALITARRGADDEAAEALAHAQAAVDDIGYHPLLGPLPETRWVTLGMVAS